MRVLSTLLRSLTTIFHREGDETLVFVSVKYSIQVIDLFSSLGESLLRLDEFYSVSLLVILLYIQLKNRLDRQAVYLSLFLS